MRIHPGPGEPRNLLNQGSSSFSPKDAPCKSWVALCSHGGMSRALIVTHSLKGIHGLTQGYFTPAVSIEARTIENLSMWWMWLWRQGRAIQHRLSALNEREALSLWKWEMAWETTGWGLWLKRRALAPNSQCSIFEWMEWRNKHQNCRNKNEHTCTHLYQILFLSFIL